MKLELFPVERMHLLPQLTPAQIADVKQKEAERMLAAGIAHLQEAVREGGRVRLGQSYLACAKRLFGQARALRRGVRPRRRTGRRRRS